MVDDADAEATAEPPVNESAVTQAEVAVEEEPEPLDTGVIPEAKPPVKKPNVTPVKPLENPAPVAKTNPPVKANTPKLLPATKPAEVVATKPVVKKPEVVAKSAVSATTNNPPETATKKPELVRWTIYAGSFSQKDNATTLLKTLRGQGIPVTLETTQSAKGPIYRLKVGPELDKKKAAANKAKLDKQSVDNVMISE
jgi:DedD protein